MRVYRPGCCTARGGCRGCSLVAGMLLAIAMGFSPALFGEDKDGPPRFEVTHFWSAPSERAAFEVISDEFRRRHQVRWIERALGSSDAVRERALQRIVEGYPPNAVLWHPSPEIWDLYDMGVIHPLTGVARKLRLEDKLPRIVLDAVVTGGEYVSLPTNVHGENFVWYSRRLYKKLGFEYPDTWERLLEQARAMHEAGIPAVAMGRGEWEKRILFLSVLNALNTQTYVALLSTGDPALADKSEVLRSFEIMAALRDASRPGGEAPDWAAAAARVAEGEAGMQFMGDWVNKELKTRGYTLAADYACRLPPGDDPAFMVLVDGFMFPRVGADKTALHEAFAEIVLDSSIQVEFALKKGALPVVKGVSDERFDECANIGLRALQDPARQAPSPAVFTSLSFGTVIQSVAARFWTSDGMSPRQAAAALREELAVTRELEHQP